ncbi:MAG: metal-dependent transcriptional regulator [Methanocorpusculum sp.]|nr:metal-dependent transcriptional regulator [Methanocorpusculum parvum]MBQ2772114.1 metal-dependent transcriptional regulator [Methanocorpusculum sp.]MBQ4134235.1 metal-dependent transcriptional regulator [Methanocorpusculum sp.]MBR4117885.1 metal-dependent transcriptional regulator [Methanocorpusculum sp.]
MEASICSPAHCKLTMKEEDYLESILNVSEIKGYAKARDVSDDLGVSPSSASEMFVKLSKKGLIVHRKYEGVTLTETGKGVAVQVRFRHDVLVEFLKHIGVSEDIADKDACFMEHELHSETIQKIKEFVEMKK